MKKGIIIFSLLLLSVNVVLAAEAENLIKNGTFDDGGGVLAPWVPVLSDGVTLVAAPDNFYLYMSNPAPRYNDITQTVIIDPEKTRVVTVKALVKIKDIVKGREDWEMARVMVLFYDRDGAQVGGWPELGRWKGSFDWAQKVCVINVPDNARTMKIQPSLTNCTGEMWLDAVSVTDGNNLIIERDPDNWLLNGGMEFGSTLPLYWGGWVAGEAVFESPGHDSATCFRIYNPSNPYSMITQSVPVDTSKIFSVTISGYVKVSGVTAGANVWEKARISVEFRDENGELVNNWWPPVTGEADYNMDTWTEWSRDYVVPAGSKNIIVSAGLLNCSGTMWLDSLKMTCKDKKGNVVLPEVPKEEDRTGWWPFEFEQDRYTADAAIDFNYLQDRPAGKHGPITATEEGSLAFSDGTPVRFWGTNLVAGDVFRDHAATDKMVKRLSKLGVNLVRLHHMDAPWAEPSIFDKTADDTRTFSEDSLEKLDYLIYKLKDAGIYVFMDMLVHRGLKKGDGMADFDKIPLGFKEVIFVDEKLQELTREYMTNLLNHVNRYTATAYKDEPAIVMSETVNETSLFYWESNKQIPRRHTQKLNAMFNDFLKKKYKNMSNLRREWDRFGDSDLGDNEDFNNGTVRREMFRINRDDWAMMFGSNCSGRGADTKEFYYATEYAFYKKMYGHMKGLGFKGLITGSNHWELWDPDLRANAALDFIDRHSYWDHPSGGWTMQENITFKNLPMIKSKMNSVTELGHARIYKKPFTCSEWNALVPNEFRAGAPILMASYASLNAWDAMLQFNFSNYEWKKYIAHFADFSVWPDTISNWPIAVLIYRAGAVSATQEKIVDYSSDNDAFFTKDSSYKLINDDYTTPLMMRSYKTFDPAMEDKKFNPVLKKDTALSLSGELYWNFSRGIFQVTTEKVQGAMGFLSAEKDWLKFRNIKIKSSNNYASIFLASLDNEPVTGSSRLVLNTSARIDNSRTKYSPAHTSVIFGGTSPILIEPVYSTLKINVKRFKSVKIYRLDANNYKKDEYKNYTTPDKNTVIIKTDENSKALLYYMEFER
ncbi:MAG: cellulase family glycosylhydrolase [Spirochaetia bacterium]|nr:cellulase family glycosylhydrolase [Spirochaetia bacterium]